MVLILSGCQIKSEYSFEDPDIIAYVNGTPVYKSQKEQYIEMKKAYYGAIVNSDKGSSDDVNLDPYSEMLNKTSEIKLDKMEQAISYSDEEWEKDYYKTFIVEDKIYYFVDKKDSYEDFINNSVDISIKDALYSGEVKLQ